MQKFVASIFFEELRVERPIYGGDFVLQAVPRGNPPTLLLVRDHTQIEQLPFSAGGHKIPRLIAGEHIADDIVAHTATMGLGMSVDCGPGVWVVREALPETQPNGNWVVKPDGQPVMRLANEQEKQQMFASDLATAKARQEQYGQYLIDRGDSYALNPKERILITKRMKAAALYYNRERNWLEDLKDGDLKICPYCVVSIDHRAVKCPNCGEIVDEVKHAAMLVQRMRIEKEALTTTKG